MRAADPAGTIILGPAHGASGTMSSIAAGQSQLGIVVRQFGSLFTEPLAGGTPHLALTDVSSTSAAAGDVVLLSRSGGAEWYDLATGEHAPTPRPWLAPASDGGVFLSQRTDGEHLFHETTSGMLSDLGVVPDLDPANVNSYSTAVLGATDGVAVTFVDSSPTFHAEYFHYGTPGVTTVDTTGVGANAACNSLYGSVIGCEEYQQSVDPLNIGGPPTIYQRSEQFADRSVTVNPVDTTFLEYDLTNDSSDRVLLGSGTHLSPILLPRSTTHSSGRTARTSCRGTRTGSSPCSVRRPPCRPPRRRSR